MRRKIRKRLREREGGRGEEGSEMEREGEGMSEEGREGGRE